MAKPNYQFEKRQRELEKKKKKEEKAHRKAHPEQYAAAQDGNDPPAESEAGADQPGDSSPAA